MSCATWQEVGGRAGHQLAADGGVRPVASVRQSSDSSHAEDESASKAKMFMEKASSAIP